ncbi:MAG: hypothetical protein LBH14_04055 [Desulfobulbaceae bacterium]|jgi:hypothetical protein|nr:hypothetical protein [Desulfobulbaceae bacterium]
MRLTIIVPDNIVAIDGLARRIDLQGFDLPPNLRVVQWIGDKGWEEYTDAFNEEITDISAYQPIIDEWRRLKTEDEARAAEEAARQADPLYGLDGEALARKKFDLAKAAADAALDVAASQPVEVGIPEGTWRYNGGDASASAILGAVTLAEALGETSVTLWDADNVLRQMSLASAMTVAVTIAQTYRAAAYARASAIAVAKAEMDAAIAETDV